MPRTISPRSKIKVAFIEKGKNIIFKGLHLTQTDVIEVSYEGLDYQYIQALCVSAHARMCRCVCFPPADGALPRKTQSRVLWMDSLAPFGKILTSKGMLGEGEGTNCADLSVVAVFH